VVSIDRPVIPLHFRRLKKKHRRTHDSVSLNVKPLKKVFLLFKEPGSCKKKILIGRNVAKVMAYQLIPLTPAPHLSCHFTVPLGQ
jgi:hypothetical protein